MVRLQPVLPLILLVVSAPAWAGPAPVADVPEPHRVREARSTVLVVGSDDDAASRRLADELRLAGVTVRLSAAGPTFAESPLVEQLEAVRGQAGEVDAVVWSSPSGPGEVDGIIAVINGDRAVVRVVRAPADSPADLALAMREILDASGPTMTPRETRTVDLTPSAEPRAVDFSLRAHVGTDLALSSPGIGLWLGGDVEGTIRFRGATSVGLSVGPRVGRKGSHRGTLRATIRRGPVLGAVGLDVTRTPWAVRTQPRVELGATLPLPASTTAELRLRYQPRRDLIVRDGEILYDSGRIEIGIFLGAVRQIAPRLRQDRP